MTYVIAEPCIGTMDRGCVDVCPVDCIYEGEDQLYIHPDECIDCGACEPECPVSARPSGSTGITQAAEMTRSADSVWIAFISWCQSSGGTGQVAAPGAA